MNCIVRQHINLLFLLFVLITCIPSLCKADSNVEDIKKLRESGLAYEHGREGVKQNYQQAYAYYCQAALKGDVESIFNLGFMYFNGRGIERNLSLAVGWFKLAAEKGDPIANNMLTRFSNVTPLEDLACKKTFNDFSRLVYEKDKPNRQQVEDWVNIIAPHYGVDPHLVMAVIQVESGFNLQANSVKNAQGLMQLIPETAQRFGVADVFNPIQNIKGGAAYLNWLLRRFEGKVELVLAAYNAGEAAVDRYAGIPPYPETMDYVKQILASYPKLIHPIPAKLSNGNHQIEIEI